jgi:hypothetical protein
MFSLYQDFTVDYLFFCWLLILFPCKRIFYLPKKVTVKEYLFTFQVSQDMGIEIPIPISVRLRDLNNIFARIVHTAQQPHLSIPETEAGKTRRQYQTPKSFPHGCLR